MDEREQRYHRHVQRLHDYPERELLLLVLFEQLEMRQELMSFRDDFEADEALVTQEISQVLQVLSSLPDSVAQLPQADADRRKAQADSLAAALSTTAPVEPPQTPADPGSDPTGD